MKKINSSKICTYLKIQEWAKEDRPRERLMSMGSHALSNVELLAILVRSGTQNMSAVDLAKQILASHDYSLSKLSKRSVKQLSKFKGIGEAKAITIISALEIAGRIHQEPSKVRRIISSKHAYKLMQPLLFNKNTEEFWAILLNKNNCVIKTSQISKGGITKVTIDPKVIFKAALEYNAVNIILVHNHPSGAVKPSNEDKLLTNSIINAAKMLQISVLDHIIFTDKGYFSFADSALIQG